MIKELYNWQRRVFYVYLIIQMSNRKINIYFDMRTFDN